MAAWLNGSALLASTPVVTPRGVVVTTPPVRAQRGGLLEACVVSTSYLCIYLGLGKLVIGFLRRYFAVQLNARVLVHGCLLLLGAGIPWSIQMTLPRWRFAGYTLLQITNPLWTIGEVCFKGVPVGVGPALMIGLPAAAFVVLVMNFFSLCDELQQVHIAKPPRVVEDDAEALTPTAATRTSPWDEDSPDG
jgi:hypothetical protein